ncbi:TetR/AcrR family transcriptional regulator [Dactylosporangium sucinum]|uniref:Transcriptional regulator n=1 Tax=Dactylosporangium sucinum TaxID=1424081 RepID=A0A917X5D9_9ACTN|nr:TetR family transcriptional regulator C-terminal domain-containing protein [Dactylosporangium sucinum]GGM68535.1 transcriptional regulator [Dactylosporangium sucinum]
MPRKVDHDERRRHIVEALLHIAGTDGLDAVSLREVAQQAGVSMGAVQHYFATKEEMLAYALRHWLSLSVHARFSGRVRVRLGAETKPEAVLRALAAEYLPHDEASRFDARVAAAFLSRAAVDPALAQTLVPAIGGFVGTLKALLDSTGTRLDTATEARRLAALLDGLRTPVLLGALPHDQAMAVVEQHLRDILARDR